MLVSSRTLGAVLLAAAAGAWSGCGKFKEKPTLGQVYAAVQASTGGDSDGDGLPDDVERRYRSALGTDPDRFDSDGDGLPDGVEVFGPSWLYLHTGGRAGALAPAAAATAADDASRDHAADLHDTDGDGVADYLEFAGFDYDWRRAAFVLSPGAFHTDPLQWSTDQDAYGDGTEVSRINMDVAVRAPGTHPLVPAYPDIVVEVTGYSVVANEQITDGQGGQVEKGSSWSRETQRQHSFGSTTGFEISGGFKLGKESGLEFGAKFNQSWTSTDTLSETVTTGGSTTESVNWNRARSYNPADAAHLKLFVRVHNRGTAPASNLVPTVNVRIGGANVATFEASAIPIHMLLPGATYPAEGGASLVLDRDGGGTPLSLTDWELRALQTRAPITVTVTQKRADVMRLTADGAWERVGDVNEYLARILSVSAGIFLDLGRLPDGEQARLSQRLVYAGSGPAAPAVTLAEALAWTDGFRGDPDAGYTLEYARDDGTAAQVPLESSAGDDATWRCLVDPATMEANWPFGGAPADATEVLGLVLHAGSQVSLRAPRPEAVQRPRVHVAYALPTEDGYEVVACASDYDAVARVVFVDKFQREVEMTRDGRGPWFYAARVTGYAFRGAQDGPPTVPELVRVESQRLDDGGAPLATAVVPEVVYTPAAQAPIIRRVTYDNPSGRFYARVEPGGALPEDEVDWVRIFHPSLSESTTGGVLPGYRALGPTIFAFEDPFGWEVSGVKYTSGMRIVAHTRGGQYTSRRIDDLQNLSPWRSGAAWLRAGFDSTWNDEFWTPEIDLDAPVPVNDECGATGQLNLMGRVLVDSAWSDCVAADPRLATHYVETDGFLANAPATIWDHWIHLGKAGRPDLYQRSDQSDTGFVLGLHVGGTVVSDFGGLTAAQFYDALDLAGVRARLLDFGWGHQGGGTAEPYHYFAAGTVLLLQTDEGRLGKAYVREVFDVPYFDGSDSWQRNAKIDYVVYRVAGDGMAPDQLAYGAPDAVYAVGRAIAPNLPQAAAGDAPDAWRLCAFGGTPCLTENPLLLPAGLTFEPGSGEIHGTPTAAFPRTALRVYGTNSAGEASTLIWITVLEPPAGLAYAPATVACETGWPCSVPRPVVTGTVEAWAIAPTLPAGLAFNPGTGAITGTPTEVRVEVEYRVTASNRAGSSATTSLLLATPLGAPGDLAYPQASWAFTVNAPITADVLPTWAGGAVDTWTVSPALPAGIELDPDTGRVWGTPTAAATRADYVVTAANAAGSTSAVLSIAVQ